MKSYDIVIGRTGESLTGKLLDRAFTIRTSLGTITAPTRTIQWIHFKRPPQMPTDELWLHNGDHLTGVLAGSAVRFKPLDGATLEIPYRAIHTIIVNQTMNPNGPRLIG